MDFKITETDFLVDGKAERLISGVIHYFRLPHKKWRHSLHNLKALGANTVETYIPWNFHEEKRGQFDFTGDRNLTEFIEIAQELGLYIILRPTPYICAEWDYGGLPSWLLKENIRIRSDEPAFLACVDRYFAQLLPRIKPYLFTNGGNVLMLQVENEYGSFSTNKNYLQKIAELMKKYDMDTPFFTSDGTHPKMLSGGTVDVENVMPTANFGSEPAKHFEELDTFFAERNIAYPRMIMEYWDGWFGQWGKPVVKRAAEEIGNETTEALALGSINYYMFHGGTNFGFYNGATFGESGYEPQITSYDYDALLDEAGNPTDKYYAVRKAIENFTHKKPELSPITLSSRDYGTLVMQEKTSLFTQEFPFEMHSETQTMEALDQSLGYILYEHTYTDCVMDNTIKLVNANDRASVFVNHEHITTRDCKEIFEQVPIHLEKGDTIRILVENRGRINYGAHMLMHTQKKGIQTGVLLDFQFLTTWKHTCLPLEDVSKIDFSKEAIPGTPTFYRATQNVAEVCDTYLDLTGKGKGCVFVNGKNLGRYCEMGPDYTLYVPKEYLKTGENEWIIFQEEGEAITEISFSDKHLYF